MNSKYKLKLTKRLYRQLLAADVAVVKPEQEDAESELVLHPALNYRLYVNENQQAIGYAAYQGWQQQGRGFIILMPLWEKDDPEMAVIYVSEANILKLPLFESGAETSKFPRWYVSLGEKVESQIMARLATYDPQTEVVILGQVEDMSQIFPDEEIYKQILRVEIFTFSEFEPSIQDCYEQFKGRACEFKI